MVGLGNPGPRYAGNRHNLGQMVLRELARRAGARLTAHRGRAQAAEVRLAALPGGVPGPRAVLVAPMSYMNLSGGPVAAMLAWFRGDASRLVVIHDDLDVPFGQVRLKAGGGEGGHNGLRSITSALGTGDYLRVRVGVGRPPGRMDAADYVLRDIPARQAPELEMVVATAADAVEMLAAEGLAAAQQRFHAQT